MNLLSGTLTSEMTNKRLKTLSAVETLPSQSDSRTGNNCYKLLLIRFKYLSILNQPTYISSH